MRSPIGWFVVVGLATLAAAGCSEPSAIDDGPTQTAKRDAGRPKKKDAAVATEVASSTGDDDESAAGDGDEQGDGSEQDDEAEGDEAVDGAGDDDPPVVVDAGRAKDAGPARDAGVAKDAGGGGSVDGPGPCPAAYMCQDPATALKNFGAEGTVTDADDKPIALACSKGSQETCDPKDPKTSCPNLPNAFCAHVVLSSPIAIDLYNCAQLCTP